MTKNLYKARTSIVLYLITMVTLAGCGEGQAIEQSDHVKMSGADSVASPKEAKDNEIKPSPLAAALGETDKMMLAQAETACKATDFKPFFEALLRSAQVRVRYFNGPIRTVKGSVDAADYHFPIQIMDYSYIVRGSAERGPNEWEYVKLEFNQAQDERYRVDWVRFDPGANGNDEGATPEDDREYGPRGYLLFYPTAECWTLVEEGVE